jgi:sulfite reductase beta subunit-like hemoprotein
VPSAKVEETVARLFSGYLEERLPGESFTQFCVRTPDAALVAIGSAEASTSLEQARL